MPLAGAPRPSRPLQPASPRPDTPPREDAPAEPAQADSEAAPLRGANSEAEPSNEPLAGGMEITALDDDEDDDDATTLGSDSEIPPIPAPRTDASGSPPDLVPELDADGPGGSDTDGSAPSVVPTL